MKQAIGFCNVAYVKWDMKPYYLGLLFAVSAEGQTAEVAHRYIQGVYRLAKRTDTGIPGGPV